MSELSKQVAAHAKDHVMGHAPGMTVREAFAMLHEQSHPGGEWRIVLDRPAEKYLTVLADWLQDHGDRFVFFRGDERVLILPAHGVLYIQKVS